MEGTDIARCMMMSKRSFEVRVEPKVLAWARTSMGKSVSEVSEQMAVSEASVEGWETGNKRPTMVQLRKLANLYKRPLAALLMSSPPMEPSLPTDFRTLPGEKSLPMTEKTRLAIRRARRLQTISHELRGDAMIPHDGRLPKCRTSDDAEAVSRDVRDVLGVSFKEQSGWEDETDALQAWRRSVEAIGVLVIQLPMPLGEARAFSLADENHPVIVLNSRDSINARIFSLMHELGHLVVRDGGICLPARVAKRDGRGVMTSGGGKGVESFCNHLAGAILVPKEVLLRIELVRQTDHQREWQNRELRNLASRFRVSREVVLRRLLLFGKTSWAFYERMHDKWLGEGAPEGPRGGGGRNIPREIVGQNGAPFVSMVLDSYRNDRITYSDVADILDVKVKHIPKIEELLGAQ